MDLATPFGFACDRCERVEARPESPWCRECGAELSELEPPVPRAHAAPTAGTVAPATRSYGTAVLAVLVAIALAFDPVGKWVVAPFALLLVLIAGLFLAVITVSRHELAALARDRRTRVVHGLEHACIAILQERGHRPISGATRSGQFEIDVDGTTHRDVARATWAAIRRIRAGETGLAYSPRCGTSMLVALMLYALIIAGGGVVSILFGVPMGAMMLGCAVLCVLAQLAARTLGLLAQRTLTVSTRFSRARVGLVTVKDGPRGPRFVVPVSVH